jgi:hypothetical protein
MNRVWLKVRFAKPVAMVAILSQDFALKIMKLWLGTSA